MFRQLLVIIWKNLIIRRRHRFLSLVEIVIPIVMFTLLAYGRSKISGMNKVEIPDVTYKEIIPLATINNIDVTETKLWYAPSNNHTDAIMKRVQQKFQIYHENFSPFPSEAEMQTKYENNSETTIYAIVFNDRGFDTLDYDIRIHDKYLTWDTNELYLSSIMMQQGLTDNSKYINKDFVALQTTVNAAFMEAELEKSARKYPSNITLTLQEFPYPPQTIDSGLNELFMNFLPIITIFSFIFICPAVLKRVVEEKESGIKELLKMVGMSSSVLWSGWFIHAMLLNLMSIIVIVVLLKVPFWGVPYPPIEFTSGGVLFVFLVFYCMAAVSLCFLITTLFSQPSIAMVVGVLVWIFSYFIPKAIMSDDGLITKKYKLLISLFPNMALNYGYSAISVYERRELGVNWSNLHMSGGAGAADVTMANVLLMLLFDFCFFMLLTVYLDQINPGNYGIAKPIHFPFLCIKKALQRTVVPKCSKVDGVETDVLFMEEGKGIDSCIEIKKINKHYGPTVAVENLSLKIYKNQITVLLGQNGAGKSTTMSMITGMIPSSSGSIIINDLNIREDIDQIRQKMGLCPQENLLFPDLTVMEHLKFFALLKGASFAKAQDEAIKCMERLDIYEKRHQMASALSGGMQRKLCLGMALIGDSDVLVLDEPTSGMDPRSRQKILDLLLQWRKSKTVLITTHHMDDAEVLGDWIAIMANGKLQCYGTPMSLKKKFNTGLNLSVLVNKTHKLNEITGQLNEIMIGKGLEVQGTQHGDSVGFLLPITMEKSLLCDLVEKVEEIEDVENVAITTTTLNDVFLKVRSCVSYEEVSSTSTGLQQPDFDGTSGLTGILCGLMIKRALFLRRRLFLYLPALLFTIAIFLIICYLTINSVSYYGYTGPRLPLSLSIYGPTGVVYGGKQGPDDFMMNSLKKNYAKAISKQDAEPTNVMDVNEGLVEKGMENIAYYQQHMVVAAEFNISQNSIVLNAMYNARALHSIPISVNLLMNAIAKTLLGDNYAINVANSPLKTIYTDMSPSELSEVEVGLTWVILISIGMLFFMSNFLIFPHSEISTNFLYMQTIAGVKPVFYWLKNIIFDSLIATFLLMIAVCMFFRLESFGINEYGGLLVILLICTFISLPYTYVFSYKQSLSGAFASFLMFGLFAGFVPTIAITIMENSGDQYYIDLGESIKLVLFTLCPPFSQSYNTLKFAEKFVANHNWQVMLPQKKAFFCAIRKDPCCNGTDTLECAKFQSYVIPTQYLLCMLVSWVIYYCLLCFLSSSLWKKVRSEVSNWWIVLKTRFKPSADERLLECVSLRGMQEERPANNKLTFGVEHLNKKYGLLEAVKNVTFNVRKGECFGLLGVNGAGKTTTFQMLTGEITKDGGNVKVISEHDQQSETHSMPNAEYFSSIGYCPQFNYLNHNLSGYELLYCMALIKGYSFEKADEVTRIFLELFGLNPYKDKPCSGYSGGNKRKLSTCLAFLSFPSIIFLDEPTTGVDPASRADFWKTLSAVKQEMNRSFILCSHSMEECEVLCDRIAIMKKGEIHATGTIGELKNQYNNGYSVVFILKPESVDQVDGFNEQTKSASSKHSTLSLKENFEGRLARLNLKSEMKDEHSRSLHWHIKSDGFLVSILIREIEQMKKGDPVLIEDYTISQLSLEDIFLNIGAEGQ